MPDEDERAQPAEPWRRRLSRRALLKGAGATAAVAGVGAVVGSACDVDPRADSDADADATATPVPTSEQYAHVEFTPQTPPDPRLLRFLTPHEAQTVEALTARILPGTPDDPGAREAGVVTYIDNKLAYADGFTEKTYRQGPFAAVYSGDSPPADSPYNVVWVSEKDIERYGYQSPLTPREVYRMGVAAVDRYAQKQNGKPFVELSEEQQDAIVGALAGGTATEFDDATLSGTSFFQTLRRDTAEGMFADPAYGGNRDLVGWKLVGFPGAQRAYDPVEFRAEGLQRAPQSIAQMMPFMTGQDVGPNTIMPVSGSDQP